LPEFSLSIVKTLFLPSLINFQKLNKLKCSCWPNIDIKNMKDFLLIPWSCHSKHSNSAKVPFHRQAFKLLSQSKSFHENLQVLSLEISSAGCGTREHNIHLPSHFLPHLIKLCVSRLPQTTISHRYNESIQ
jgi:hypothetical protein